MIREAEKEGILQGENQKAISIAKEMLKDGMPIESISKYSGLTKDEIENL